MVFSIDTIDRETWSDKGGDPHWRIRRHEQWMDFITREAVPFIRGEANRLNGWEGYPGIWVQLGRAARSQPVFPLSGPL